MTILFEDLPPRGDRAFTSYRTPGYRNIWIVIILSAVSAFLATILITAILCMVRPCSSNQRRQHRNRTRQIIEGATLGHHPLYDLHDNGILYSTGKKSPYEPNFCPTYPGSEGLLEHMMIPGMDTYMTSNQYFMSSPGESGYGDMQQGSQDGLGTLHDSNWNLGQNRHGQLCVDGNHRGSQEFVQTDRLATLQKSRTKKATEQIRMWPYDPGCGKCPTLSYASPSEQLATMGTNHLPRNPVEPQPVIPANQQVGYGIEEQQSDSGRGGSDEELPHGLVSGHLFHHGGAGTSVASSSAAQPVRGTQLVTFNSPQTNHSSVTSPPSSNHLNIAGSASTTSTSNDTHNGGSILSSYSHLRSFPTLPPISTLTKPPPKVNNNNKPHTTGSVLPPYTPSSGVATATCGPGSGAVVRPALDQIDHYSPSLNRSHTTSTNQNNAANLAVSRGSQPAPVSSSTSSSTDSQVQNPVVVSLVNQNKSSKKSDPERLCDEIDQLFFKDML